MFAIAYENATAIVIPIVVPNVKPITSGSDSVLLPPKRITVNTTNTVAKINETAPENKPENRPENTNANVNAITYTNVIEST